MMPFRRGRRQNLSPVNRIKHVVDAQGTVTAGVTLSQPLILTVDAPVIGDTRQCITGSKVNGIYLKVEVASTESDPGAIPNCYLAIFKDPGGLLTTPNPVSIGDEVIKKYIIHQEMVMLNNTAGGNPRVLFNGVIAIPKGYRRNGPLDELSVLVRSTAVNFAFCMQAHYKEFR